MRRVCVAVCVVLCVCKNVCVAVCVAVCVVVVVLIPLSHPHCAPTVQTAPWHPTVQYAMGTAHAPAPVSAPRACASASMAGQLAPAHSPRTAL